MTKGTWARGLTLTAAIMFAAPATAQAPRAKPLAPWFDSDGFYNKPGVELGRAKADFTVCRAEALRLKTARRQTGAGHQGPGTAFTPDGKYDPVLSGVATGVASILFAIQNASYNASIESTEFRDCAVSLGYRRFTLLEAQRIKYDATEDRGFAKLASSLTPEDGSESTARRRDNYYSPELAVHAYENQQPTALAENGVALANAVASPTKIDRIGAGAAATPTEGMAIIVASARQTSGMAVAAEGFHFRRVTVDGRFVDLLKPDAAFNLEWFGSGRGKDPTFKGKATAPRYSTFQIPAGRYVLSYVREVNACLGTITFDVKSGDVLYLGDFAYKGAGMPVASLFMPFANINKGMDNNLKDDVGVGIGDEFETARAALQADDASKAALRRVAYQNGYRIPCDGDYIGRVNNDAWSNWNAGQGDSFNDSMAAKIEEATAGAPPG